MIIPSVTAVDWKRNKELKNFLAAYFSDADSEGLTDEEAAQEYSAVAPPAKIVAMIAQARALLDLNPFPAESVGDEANRWFGQSEDRRRWLRRMIDIVIEERRTQAPGAGA